jgi:hypothetical protein
MRFCYLTVTVLFYSCTTVIPKNVFDACDDACDPLAAVEVGKKFTGNYCCKCSDGSVEELIKGMDIPGNSLRLLQEESITYTLSF